MSLLPILLTTHIALAIALFLPSVLLPFTLRRRRGTPAPGRAVRSLLYLQGHGTLVIGAGLALTGVALLGLLGTQVLGQPWLVLALGIYAVNLVLAFFIQRPNLRRLIGLGSSGDHWEDELWRARARRQRYVSYAMAGLVGVIAFLMSSKPTLW